MKQVQTQKLHILRALRKGRKLTAMDALREFGCMRLGARIWDLKEDHNIPIQSELIETPNGSRVSRYWISAKDRKRLTGKSANLLAHHATPQS
jgi:hypothetical protein